MQVPRVHLYVKFADGLLPREKAEGEMHFDYLLEYKSYDRITTIFMNISLSFVNDKEVTPLRNDFWSVVL